VVLAVAGVGSDEHGVAHAVRVEHSAELVGPADLLARRQVVGVRRVREPPRVEDVVVAVDLRLVQDAHA
jgi:hypothetical protein